GVVCSLRKEMAEQQSSILNEIKLKSIFEGGDCHVGELYNRFSDVINLVESLLHTYEESKKIEKLSHVELDLAMEAAAARAELHALLSVELENEVKCGLINLTTPSSFGDKIEVDGHLLESEDVGPSGSEAFNKCQKIDEGKKPDEGVPRWDLITHVGHISTPICHIFIHI
ncbi:hypothetical protein HAX54_024010, partial [Datura stramonium]|nr:hypothetical protein [Datura stramonium]